MGALQSVLNKRPNDEEDGGQSKGKGGKDEKEEKKSLEEQAGAVSVDAL